MPPADRTPHRRQPATLTDIRLLSLSALAGTSLLHLLPQLPPVWGYGIAVLTVLMPWRWRWLVLAALLSAGWSHWHAQRYLDQRWIEARYGETRWITGWVSSLPDRRPSGTRFLFEPLQDLTGRIRVSQFPSRPSRQPPPASAPALQVLPGECYRLQLRLRPIRGLGNPGSFDSEGWAYRENLLAQAYVRGWESCTANDQARLPAFRRLLLHLRARATAGIDAAIGAGHSQRGVIGGLTLGDDAAISDTQWESLRRTGTTHLISISGLHIALMAGIAFWLLRRAWCVVPGLALRYPAPRAAAVGAILVATGYALLAGFSIPTQRSWIMSALVLGAMVSGRHTTAGRVLALALLLVLALEPAAVMSAGFWLSFLAIGWIAYLLQGRLRPPGKLMGWLGLQFALTLALAPVVLLVFGETSLISPLANLLLIPAYSILLPVLLVAVAAVTLSLPGAASLLALLATVMEWLWQLLEALAATPLAVWSGPPPGLWATVAALLGLLAWLAPRGWPARALALALWVPLLVAVSGSALNPPLPPGTARLTLIDVGQGLSALVQTQHHQLLFDTGPAGEGYDAGSSTILPYLRQMGIRTLQGLVVSHSDLDHRGGLPAILQALPVSQRWGAEGGQPCRAGSRWDWDGVRFEFLHPADDRWQGNNASCVLRVQARDQSLLLTGDIEAVVEAELVAGYGATLRSDVLVLAHHGSATSSSANFLAAVQPRWALIPAGWHNRYRHPSAKVLQRLRERNLPFRSTADGGMIVITLGKDASPQPRVWRGRLAHFWSLPPGSPTQQPAKMTAQHH